MRPLAVLALTLAFLAPALGAAPPPPQTPVVSLLTFAPGAELYATFGHTAFRVQAPDANVDYVFNYGTFPFGAPDFYLNFVRGRLDYQLSVTRFDDELAFQKEAGREVRELVLNLTPDQANALTAALFHNAQPENRAYRYEFLSDNCATRPRDLLERVLGPQVPWGDGAQLTNLSFRDRLDPYLASSPWIHWGINLIVGAPADRKTTVRESFFLPNDLEAAIEGTSLVKEARVDFRPAPSAPVQDWTPGPGPVLWVLALGVLGLCYAEFRRGRRFRSVDAVLFSVSAFVGLVILFLWFLSDHGPVRPNANLVWAFPLGLALVPFLGRAHRWDRWAWGLVAAQSVIGLALMVPGPWGRLDPTGIPLVLMLGVRAALVFVLPAPVPRRRTKKAGSPKKGSR